MQTTPLSADYILQLSNWKSCLKFEVGARALPNTILEELMFTELKTLE